jgi:glycosyltransferase involved in cell wall biosynthesis
MSASVSAAPILVVVFNRPGKTRALVDQLLAFEGLDILVAADGPRTETERVKTDAVRAIVGELDGRHRVRTKFANRNLGCGANVIDGIRWAFEQHERLIIIEDDIQISREFLDFCNHGLEAHRNRDDVVCISSGPLVNLDPTAFPATFLTRYPNIWGWATWRYAFADYSITLEQYTLADMRRVLANTFPGRPVHRAYFLMLLLLIRSGRVDGWDFQYYFMAWAKRAFALTPTRNLAENIGFDADATHMKRAPENVARMADQIDVPAADLATAPVAPSETYNRLIERDLWHISAYRVARFVAKYLITRPRRYDLSATTPEKVA